MSMFVVGLVAREKLGFSLGVCAVVVLGVGEGVGDEM